MFEENDYSQGTANIRKYTNALIPTPGGYLGWPTRAPLVTLTSYEPFNYPIILFRK